VTVGNECVRLSVVTESYLITRYLGPRSVVVDDHIAPRPSGPIRSSARFPAYAERFVRSLTRTRVYRCVWIAFRAAHTLGFPRAALAEGTYAWVTRADYEKRGEARLLAGAGASG